MASYATSTGVATTAQPLSSSSSKVTNSSMYGSIYGVLPEEDDDEDGFGIPPPPPPPPSAQNNTKSGAAAGVAGSDNTINDDTISLNSVTSSGTRDRAPSISDSLAGGSSQQQDLQALAPGWAEFADVSGSSYFYHLASNTASWTRPCRANANLVRLRPQMRSRRPTALSKAYPDEASVAISMFKAQGGRLDEFADDASAVASVSVSVSASTDAKTSSGSGGDASQS